MTDDRQRQGYCISSPQVSQKYKVSLHRRHMTDDRQRKGYCISSPQVSQKYKVSLVVPVPSTNSSYVDFSKNGLFPNNSTMSSLSNFSFSSNLKATLDEIIFKEFYIPLKRKIQLKQCFSIFHWILIK